MLKVMRVFDADALNIAFLRYFENSFVDLKNHKHPNIVNLYEFAPIRSSDEQKISGNQYFYTYEYVNNHLVSYMDLEKSQITEVISQLCKVLRFLHFRGVVYKYLNFENIKIYLKPDNDVLVKLSNLANISIIDYQNSATYEYTSDFIAPELNWGENIVSTADIYSFGIIFFYLYYKKDYRQKALNNIVSTNPLNLFIARCTSQISEDRYQTVDELIEELSRLIWVEVPKDDYRSYDRIQDGTRLVGREREVAEVMNLIDKKMQKTTSVNRIHIVGENGSGKTRTMLEIARLCGFRQHNYVMIEVPKNAESFYCVRAIVKNILDNDINISNLLSKYGEEIGMLLPTYFANLNLVNETLDLEEDHLRIINRAVKFVHDYCSSRYIVILVDSSENMHLYDQMFFSQLLSSHQNNGALAILAMPYSTRITDVHSVELKLSYFDVEQIGEMVKILLGINYIPFDLVHAILIETRGKASQIRSLLIAYYNSGVVRFSREKYAWVFSDNESDYAIQNYSDYIVIRDDLLEGISTVDRNYLRRLAVINKGFSIDGTIKMFGLSEEDGKALLDSFLDRGLLVQNISDVHYVYSLQDRDVKNLLYQSLTPAEVRVFSALAANIAIDEYHKTGYLDENIVDYFSNALMYENAADYALLIAEKNVSANDFGKVIDMLEISEEMYRKLGNQEKADSIVIRLSENLYNLGSLDNMLHIIEGRAFANPEHEMKARLLLARAYFDHVRNQEAKEVLVRCLHLASQANHYDYLFASYNELINYYIVSWEDFKAVELLTSAKQIAYDNHQDAFYKFFLYKETVIAGNTQDFRELPEFEDAKKAFEEKGDNTALIELYDIEAERLYIDVGDMDAAIEMLNEGERIAVSENYLRHAVNHHYYTGLFHWHSSLYAQAAEHFEKSMILARNYHVDNLGLMALSKYVSTKLELCEYRQVNIQLSKLEYGIKSFGNHRIASFDLFIYKLEYLCRMNQLVEAKQQRYDLSTDRITNPNEVFTVRILDIRINYLSDILRGRLELDEDILVSLHEMSKNLCSYLRGKLFRKLVLDIAMNMVMNGDLSYITRLLKLDEEAIKYYTSRELELARNMVSAYLGADAIERLKMIAVAAHEVSYELEWRVHYLIGKMYGDEKNDIQSLKSLLSAFEIVKELTDRVPAIYQRQYVLNDPFKMLLKSQINWIVKYLCDLHRLDLHSELPKIMSIEDYFDLSNYVRMMEQDEIASLIIGQTVVRSSAELMQSFGLDDRKNLHKVLEYLAKEVFAKRGFIFIMGDDDDYYRDVITLRADDAQGSFTKFLFGLGNEKSVVASKLNSKTQVHLLKGNQKGLIHLPIVELEGERRHSRSDGLIHKKKKVVAHLFLETDSIINRFDRKYMDYIESYASLIAVFIDSTKLKFSSTVDKLTKVHLRKYFEQEFSMFLAEARAGDDELSVIILDIDNFKGVNDTYGHKKGDMVLAAVGDILVRSVRSTDIVARYGGEEFILLLPSTRMESAYLVAEKIRRNVEAAELLGNERPLTISLGVSTFPQSGSSEEVLIENADKALYYSKGHGKNQTTKWSRSILNQSKRFDRLTGIVTGRVEEDMRHVQAMLNIISFMGSADSKEYAREEVFRTLLDIVNGAVIEFYVMNDSSDVVEAVSLEIGGQLRNFSEYDMNNIRKFGLTNISDYFIDWENPILNESANTTDWESVIVNSFHSRDYNGLLLIKVPISSHEFGFSDFNFVASIRKVIERIVF